MKTILVTAYAVNPFKGSEDGMGWNFIMQIARYNKVIAFTRRNNGTHIRRFIIANPAMGELFQRIEFRYFDWPSWMLFWKKGPVFSMIYFYLWQFSVALSVRYQRISFDIAHNLNFHNDWTPSFLWLTGKPFIWGPVGHHDAIPKAFIKPVYGTAAFVLDRILWAIKSFFWNCDPFLWITAQHARKVICMNSHARKKINLPASRCVVIPSVAVEDPRYTTPEKKEGFVVLSAGRFVPLKGFDLTIRAFAMFYHKLSVSQQADSRLVLIGKGPRRSMLVSLVIDLKIEKAVTIIDWLPRQQLQSMYETAQVFLFPSHEGAGMVVAEAMSYGLPVVCLNNSGPGEFLHKRSQLSVPVSGYRKTCEDLSARLEKLHSDASFYQEESELAQTKFRACFRWDARGEQLRKLYDQVLPDNKMATAKIVTRYKDIQH